MTSIVLVCYDDFDICWLTCSVKFIYYIYATMYGSLIALNIYSMYVAKDVKFVRMYDYECFEL